MIECHKGIIFSFLQLAIGTHKTLDSDSIRIKYLIWTITFWKISFSNKIYKGITFKQTI